MPDELAKWLTNQGFEEYASTFHDNKIDLSILPDLTVDDLKEMGVAAVGDRRRIMSAIASLDARAIFAPDVPDTPATAAKRQVTVMFVDLSGFTSLSSQMDAEDTHTVLNAFFAATDGIIEKFGGRVDKHIGDAVMAVFGVHVSNTNDTERAARAALEIHAALPALDPPLPCHIGIACGQVIASATGSEVHTEYTIIGDGVNLAARLTDKAEAGETLISSDVHLALGERFLGESRGDTAIHGFDAPLAVWQLTGLAGNLRTRRHRFVGRDREISLFRAAFERCQVHSAGEVHAVLGEPGIGKTHLSEEIADIARDMGYSVHRGTVLDFGALEGRSAIQDIVRSLLDLESEADVSAAVGAIEAAEAAGWIDPANRAHLNGLLELPQEAGAAEVYAKMDNATRLRGRRSVLENLVRTRSAESPLLFQIEDIHWATPDIQSASAHLAAAICDRPCLMMVTSRIDGDPLGVEWQAQTNGVFLTKLELHGLSSTQARELTQALVETNGQMVEGLIERAGGNPLFLEQLLSSPEGIAGKGLPGSIQGIVQSRLDGIDPAARTAIQAASVLGQRLSLDALEFLLEDVQSDVQSVLRPGLIRESGKELVFAHALIRDGAYEGLFKAERNRLHLRAAEWFKGHDSTLRAQHLDRGQSPDAAEAYLEAAGKLIGSYQFDAAEPLLERALELPVNPAVRFDLLCALGEAMRHQGRPQEALVHCDAAVALAETAPQRCRIHIERAQSARQTSQYEQALESLDAAEAVAEETGDEAGLARVHYLRGNIYFPLGRFEDAVASNAMALDLARKLGSARLEVGALSGFGDTNFMNGSMQTAVDYYAQAVARARPDGLVRDVAANLHNLAVARAYCGDLDQGKADAIEAVDIAQSYFAPVPECVAQTCLGVALTLRDEIDAALEAFAKSAEVGLRVGAKRLEAQALEHLARTQVYAGQRKAAQQNGQVAVDIALEHGPNFVGPKSLSALALALEDPEAQDRLLDQGQEIVTGGCVGHNHLHFYPDACAIMLARGDWDRALRYADALDRFCEKERLPLVDLVLREVRHLARAGQSGKIPNEGPDAESLCAEFARMGVRRSLTGRTDFAH